MLVIGYIGGPLDGEYHRTEGYNEDILSISKHNPNLYRYTATDIYEVKDIPFDDLGLVECTVRHYKFHSHVKANNLVEIKDGELHEDTFPYAEHWQFRCKVCEKVCKYVKRGKDQVPTIEEFWYKAECGICPSFSGYDIVFVPDRTPKGQKI